MTQRPHTQPSPTTPTSSAPLTPSAPLPELWEWAEYY